MIYDYSRLKGEESVYNLTDLKVYYNWQLPELIGIIEELIGVQYKPIMLFTKVLPRLKYYISTSFRISSGYYGGYNNTTSGTD